MASCLFCINRCLSRTGLTDNRSRRRELPTVILDTNYVGNEVVIVKNGHRICGEGAALGNAPIVQTKAYFEVKVQQSGLWGLGLATRKADLNKLPLGKDAEGWMLTSDGTVLHCGEIKAKVQEVPQEGDIIGISYDHVELKFYLNGKDMQCAVSGLKGTLYPAVYVEDGAIIDVHFANFFHMPPQGFEKIMIEQSLL